MTTFSAVPREDIDMLWQAETLRISHAAFADESHWNVGRYRGIGLVTLTYGDVGTVEQDLNALLRESNVKEFEWKKLKTARERFAARKLSRFAIDAACKRCLRVDVLTWDAEDRRHKVAGRDDVANLQRMYYHLFKNVLRERWPDGCVWGLYPDENTAMDWTNVQNFLDSAGSELEVHRNLLTGGKLHFRLKEEFKIQEIQPGLSHDKPLIQLADLFAGLAIFSRERFADFASWRCSSDPQLSYLERGSPISMSRSDEQRFKVLHEFDKLCKQRRLGVSLNSEKGLKTFKPANPINFWPYEPQHPMDKAPTKSERSTHDPR